MKRGTGGRRAASFGLTDGLDVCLDLTDTLVALLTLSFEGAKNDIVDTRVQ